VLRYVPAPGAACGPVLVHLRRGYPNQFGQASVVFLFPWSNLLRLARRKTDSDAGLLQTPAGKALFLAFNAFVTDKNHWVPRSTQLSGSQFTSPGRASSRSDSSGSRQARISSTNRKPAGRVHAEHSRQLSCGDVLPKAIITTCLSRPGPQPGQRSAIPGRSICLSPSSPAFPIATPSVRRRAATRQIS
jgi:hypothetical protein